MIQYIVSVSVPNDRAVEWETWMKEKHIDDVMATDKFISAQFSRIHSPESDTHTGFSTQYTAKNMDEYNDYRLNFAPALQADHSAIFGTSVTASRVVLEEIKKW